VDARADLERAAQERDAFDDEDQDEDPPRLPVRALHAPVVHIPEVLSPRMCRRLIRAHRQGPTIPGAFLDGAQRWTVLITVIDMSKRERR
jgi:hypothetical protein